MFFYSFIKAFKFVKIRAMSFSKPIQLTFGEYGHTLHHCQVMSPDNEWVVYDTRNEDSAIGTTTRIERVNVKSKAVEVLYEVEHYNAYGPGVGAVTYAPHQDMVLFIHGLKNASVSNPYAMDRRTGVGIDPKEPYCPIYFDARDVRLPFTKGALRGGTHSHCWHPDGELISFTYNDEVLNKAEIANDRVVGVMFPQRVEVLNADDESFSGNCFSVVVATIVNNAKNGSDQIEKAFDECWVGQQRTIAFQGWVRDENGLRQTEIFTVELPHDLSIEDELPLKGTISKLPSPPKAVYQKRVTYTPKGISSFRHWLRSSPDGKYVYFLMENDQHITNIYKVNVENGEILPVTDHATSIHSPFNLSPDGTLLTYFCNHSLMVYNTIKRSFNVLIASNLDLYGIPSFDKNGTTIYYNQYVKTNLTSKFLQIFKINL